MRFVNSAFFLSLTFSPTTTAQQRIISPGSLSASFPIPGRQPAGRRAKARGFRVGRRTLLQPGELGLRVVGSLVIHPLHGLDVVLSVRLVVVVRHHLLVPQQLLRRGQRPLVAAW